MRGLIRRLDGYLVRRLGLVELTQDPGFVLRVRVMPAPRNLELPGRLVLAGERVLDLHLWNERLPQASRPVPGFAWAVRFQRLLLGSLCGLATQIGEDSRLAGVAAVGGITSLALTADGPRAERWFERQGFVLSPHRGRLGEFGAFWEKVHGHLIMWAFSGPAGRHPPLGALRLVEFWMSTEEFVRRFALPVSRTRA